MLHLSLNYNQLNLAYLERALLFYQACSQDILYQESVMSVHLLGPANFLYFIYFFKLPWFGRMKAFYFCRDLGSS